MNSHPTIEQLREHVRYLAGCCLHSEQAKLADTATSVVAAVCGCDEEYGGNSSCSGPPCGGSENEETWLFRAKGGKWGVLEESEDYTGHG